MRGEPRRANGARASRLRQFHAFAKTQRAKLLPVVTLALAVVLSGCNWLGWFDDGSVVAQTSGLSYAIVDTGQELTYDDVNSLAVEPQAGQPFYGQDAQVAG